jgi:hypothetical protein
MPRPRSLRPAYYRRRSSHRAYVTLDGRPVYLGTYNSPESHAAYLRVIGEWLARGRTSAPAAATTAEDGDDSTPRDPASGLTVTMLLDAYWQHAERYYCRPDGNVSSELSAMTGPLRLLRELFGSTPAGDFGPLSLKAVREAMVQRGWSRTSVNKQCNRVKQVFRFAAESELLPAAVYDTLRTVTGLRRGRSEARESEPVKPVPQPMIDAVRPLVSQQVRALIDLQLLTGARPRRPWPSRPRALPGPLPPARPWNLWKRSGRP